MQISFQKLVIYNHFSFVSGEGEEKNMDPIFRCQCYSIKYKALTIQTESISPNLISQINFMAFPSRIEYA
jgi:hypothetical protein